MSFSGPSLGSLLHSVPYQAIGGDLESIAVASIAIDSRAVAPGALFVALRGEQTDGHQFTGDAIARGASAVVVEYPGAVPAGARGAVVPDATVALSKIADAFFGSPSQAMTVAGVTGTNGKTTTTNMIAAISRAAGVHAGTIGTIGTNYSDVNRPLAHTTPLAPELHSLLAQMRESGVTLVAMEVSSHALALKRVDDVRFEIAALTNITRDHLDFHKTHDAYAAAKRRLFTLAESCIFNADDAYGKTWAQGFRGTKPVVTYALESEADLRAQNIELRANGSAFDLDGSQFTLRIPGRFNIANALCAIAVARKLDIADNVSAQGLESLERVVGRMERVSGGDGDVEVIVDYAHTPDALENALRALRGLTPGRRIVVFGCGGDRDRGKRPEMGAVVARHADFAFVTSDNPRSEDPRAIINDILPGLHDAPYAVEPDRRKAIAAAIAAAKSGDVVLIAGKGHENYQIVGANVLPFDDAAEARRALAEREHARA